MCRGTRHLLSMPCGQLRAVFSWVFKVISRLLSSCFTMQRDWFKSWCHFLNQWKSRPKPIVTCSYAFSRAWRRVYVFASNSDWPIALFLSVVKGQSNCFGLTGRESGAKFRTTDTTLKTARSSWILEVFKGIIPDQADNSSLVCRPTVGRWDKALLRSREREAWCQHVEWLTELTAASLRR